MKKLLTKGMVALLGASILLSPTGVLGQDEASADTTISGNSETGSSQADESASSVEAPDYDSGSIEGLTIEETGQLVTDLYLQSLDAGEAMTRENLETVIQMSPTREEATDDYAMQEYDIEQDGKTLTIYAEYGVGAEADDTIQNLTVNISYPENIIPDLETAEAKHDQMAELIQSDYDAQQFTTAGDAIEIFGEPSNLTLVGDFKMHVYQVDPEVIEDESLEFVLVTNDDNLLTFNRHQQNEARLNDQFGQSSADLNQLYHTSGVTLEEMTSIFGQPMSVYYDLLNQTVNYLWYSNADPVANEITYTTDLRGISIGMAYQLTDDPTESSDSVSENNASDTPSSSEAESSQNEESSAASESE